jgi:phospholipase/carboxylesterase
MDALPIGPLRVRAAGGTDRRGGGDGPAILLCHGFGAPGDDLVSLARVIDAGPGVRWFFPEAPIELDVGYGMTGRAWWPIDLVRIQERAMRGEVALMRDETPDGLPEASAALEGCIEALVKDHGVARERLVVGGFSQGGMLATEVALARAAEAARTGEAAYAGLVVLSGTLLSADRWREALRTGGPLLHVLQSHGRADPLLPFDAAEALRAMLEEAGAKVTWVPHNGQHEIPSGVMERLGAFARARFAAP